MGNISTNKTLALCTYSSCSTQSIAPRQSCNCPALPLARLLDHTQFITLVGCMSSDFNSIL